MKPAHSDADSRADNKSHSRREAGTRPGFQLKSFGIQELKMKDGISQTKHSPSTVDWLHVTNAGTGATVASFKDHIFQPPSQLCVAKLYVTLSYI